AEHDLRGIGKPSCSGVHVVLDGTTLQSFWISCARRQQYDLVVGWWHDGNGPLAVRRQRLRATRTQHDWSGTVRRPNPHLIRKSGIFPFRAEQDSLPVRRDVRDDGPI